MILETAFWSSASAVVYHHVAYPALLRVLGQRAGRPAMVPSTCRGTPTITLIVPAYQEEGFISEKIRNMFSLIYPRNALRVRIICDGCTDRTVELAKATIEEMEDPTLDIAVIDHAVNRGKVAILNEAISAADSDLICLSDASASFAADGLERLARHFADATVGVACGRYALRDPGSEGERAYWDYQTAIKVGEANLGSPMGFHGAGYMFRRDLWCPLEPDTINDDFIQPMRIVAAGCRGVYDIAVPTFELERAQPDQEFRRRVRIAAGNMQQALRLFALADPRRPGIAFSFLSGKALRAFTPLLLVLVLASSLVLAASGSPFFAFLSMAQVAGYGLAAAVLARRSLPWPKQVRWGAYLVEGHLAGLIGATRYLRGLERGNWGRAVASSGEPTVMHFVPATTRIAKRAVDIALAGVVFVVFAATFPFIAVAIRLDSKGPLFYRQLRVGEATPRFTRLFHMIKYRTMRVDAEARSGAMWATANDPRITRIGRFMRKTRLDELPQCINVLTGDMSIIGPRPERPSFFRTLETAIPFYAERTYGLRPGISGLAQVNQGYDTSIEDVRNKVLHDHAYAMRLTTLMGWIKADVGIIFRTGLVMVTGRGQ